MNKADPMTNPALRECPHCGGNAIFQSLVIEAVIFCEICKSKIIRPHSGGEKYRMLDGNKAVIKAWNQRSSPTQEIDREKLAALISDLSLNEWKLIKGKTREYYIKQADKVIQVLPSLRGE